MSNTYIMFLNNCTAVLIIRMGNFEECVFVRGQVCARDLQLVLHILLHRDYFLCVNYKG